MFRTRWITLASLGLAVTLVVGLFAVPTPGYAQGGGGRDRLANALRFVRDVTLQATADATSLTIEQVRAELANGKTIEALVTEKGGDLNKVKADIRTKATEAINQAVKDGTLRRPIADRMIDGLDAAIDRLVTTNWQAAGARLVGAGEYLALLEATQQVTGLTLREIREQISVDGATLATVITAAGKTVDEVKAEAIRIITAQLETWVANGRLQQAQADKILADLDTTLDTLLNTPPGQLVRGRADNATNRLTARIRALAVSELLEQTARAANMTQRELLAELRAGKTLADVATANNTDPAAIVKATVGQFTTQITQQVTNGRLTQAQADEILAGIEQELTDLMNAQNPLQIGTQRGGKKAS